MTIMMKRVKVLWFISFAAIVVMSVEACTPVYKYNNVKMTYQGYQTIDDNSFVESFPRSNDISIINNQLYFGQDTVIQVQKLGCILNKCSWEDEYFVYSLNWSFWKRKFFIYNRELRNLEVKFYLTRIETLK